MTTQDIDKQCITALILAGGEGRRTGGLDKGLITYRGKPLIQHVIERLAPQVDTVIISCNRNTSDYLTHCKTLVSDTRAGFLGPLAGIESALPAITTSHVLISPCDTPHLPLDLVERLQHAAGERASGSVTATIANDGNRDHYLNALITREGISTVVDELNQGQRAVRKWLLKMNTARADFSDCPEAFLNINTL
ncbi:MAG: molybdenum cofactor guanylyltransferase MobA [Halioglobus sp.]